MQMILLLASLLAYDPATGANGVGDLTKPAAVTDETPAVLLIHGGGWGGMDRHGVDGIANFLRDDLGCVVYNIDYRLASPKNPWPACGDDCVKAAEFMFTDAFAAEAGVRPKKIWVIGGSAGGHLTLWTALKLPAEKVAGAVSISGIADPEVDYPSHPGMYAGLFGVKDPKAVTREMRDSMSVMKLIRPNGPKILLTHATQDKVVPIATAKSFLAAYRSAGNEIGLFEYPSYLQPGLTGHCIWIPGSKPHRLIPRLEREIEYFMKSAAVPEPKPAKTKFDISALYYPGTEHRPEWDMVEQVYPNWKPLLGWYDESDPENVDWQIKWAVEHGITSFCTCWYWNQGVQRLDHWVQAFYRAKHRRHLKWYIMCANHNQRGAHSTADQVAVTKFWIDNYLKTPEYYTIDGKPVIVYCTAANLDRDFIDEAKARGETLQPGEGMRRALDISEKMAKDAGLPGIYWINMSWLRRKDEIAFAPSNLDWLRRGGFVARMTYNLGGNTPYDMSPELRTPEDSIRNADYGLMVAAAEKVVSHADDAPDLPFWPVVPTGYNDTSRAFQNASLTRDISIEKFTRACKAVRKGCDEKGIKHVVVAPINEWQEGSLAEPNHDYGFARYDAIRDAFCERPDEGWPENLTPEKIGLPFHEFPPMYFHPTQTWMFDVWQEGWFRNPFGAYTVTWNEGMISFRKVSHDYSIRTRIKPFDAAKYKRFRLRMRLAPNPADGPVDGTPRRLQLKWGTTADPIIRPDRTVDFFGENVAFSSCVPDGQWHECLFDLDCRGDWRGQVDELWLGLSGLPKSVIDIDWMRFE